MRVQQQIQLMQKNMQNDIQHLQHEAQWQATKVQLQAEQQLMDMEH
jgi:hypothetical protein